MFNRRTILPAIFFTLSALNASADTVFTDLNDQPARVENPAVVNFWATWCAPCIKELPDLEELGEKLDGSATVYLVNFGESTETIEQFKAENASLFGAHTTLLKDATMAGLSAYGLRGVPTTVLINQDGDTVESVQGIKAWGSDAVVEDVKAKILP